jgi:hypothetical protein
VDLNQYIALQQRKRKRRIFRVYLSSPLTNTHVNYLAANVHHIEFDSFTATFQESVAPKLYPNRSVSLFYFLAFSFLCFKRQRPVVQAGLKILGSRDSLCFCFLSERVYRCVQLCPPFLSSFD